MLVRYRPLSVYGSLADQLHELVARRELAYLALRVFRRICEETAEEMHYTISTMQRKADAAHLTEAELITFDIYTRIYVERVLATTRLASCHIQSILIEECYSFDPYLLN